MIRKTRCRGSGFFFFLPKRRKPGIIILSIGTAPLLLLLVISLEASSVQAGLALFLAEVDILWYNQSCRIIVRDLPVTDSR